MRESSSRAHGAGDRTAHDRFYPAPHDRHLTREPIGFHVTIRLADDRPIATTPAALRTVARVVLGQGEARGLLAFGAADDHIHAALATDRACAGAFARYVESALVWQLGLAARFDPARIRPLQDQKHAYNTFHYAHRQDTRHELDLDRAREGTSLPDLLGLRVLETSLIARVRRHLPRIRREQLVEQFFSGAFGVNTPLDLDVLADAAAAALALADLRGRSADVLRARRAAVHAAGADVPSRLLCDCLGIGARAVQHLRTQRREPSVIDAVQQQARLRRATKTLADGSTGQIPDRRPHETPRNWHAR
jgi:hypothetical protein